MLGQNKDKIVLKFSFIDDKDLYYNEYCCIVLNFDIRAHRRTRSNIKKILIINGKISRKPFKSLVILGYVEFASIFYKFCMKIREYLRDFFKITAYPVNFCYSFLRNLLFFFNWKKYNIYEFPFIWTAEFFMMLIS